MTYRLDSQPDLENAIQALVRQDPRLQRVLEEAGMPHLARRDPGFAGLAAIIVGQQLSVASAAAIWRRLSEAFEPFHHEALRRARTDRLRRLGLSVAKIKTIKFVATEIALGRLDLPSLANLEAEEAHSVLTALHGIGA